MQLQKDAYEYKLTTWSEKRKEELISKRYDILDKQRSMEENAGERGFKETGLSRTALTDVDFTKYTRKYRVRPFDEHACFSQESLTTSILIGKESAHEKFGLNFEELEIITLNDFHCGEEGFYYKGKYYWFDFLGIKIKANKKRKLRFVGDKVLRMGYNERFQLVLDVDYAYWIFKVHEQNHTVNGRQYHMLDSELNLRNN